MEVYEAVYQLRVDEIDFNNRVKVESVFRYLQETATIHAYRLGFGRPFMEEHSAFWVLLRMSLLIHDYVGFEDSIRIRTWPTGKKKFLFGRDFLIADNDGRKLMEASSVWAIVDKNMRKLVSQPDFVNYINVESERSLVNPEKVFFDRNEGIKTRQRSIVYSDLDLNNHVNNATYIRWMFDLLDLDHLKAHKARQVDINYLNEIREDMEVTLSLYHKGNETYFGGSNEGIDFFHSRIVWEE